jgi:ketosteroid isomerase-like protein
MSRFKTLCSFAAVAVLALGLAGCAAEAPPPPPEEPKVDVAAEKAAVSALNAKWLELYKARDAAGIASLFDANGYTISGTDGLSDGPAEITATNQKSFDENPDASADWGSKQVWMSESGDLAVERGWWTVDDDGEGKGAGVNGEYLTVFIKVGGEWKILADASVPLEGVEEATD